MSGLETWRSRMAAGDTAFCWRISFSGTDPLDTGRRFRFAQTITMALQPLKGMIRCYRVPGEALILVPLFVHHYRLRTTCHFLFRYTFPIIGDTCERASCPACASSVIGATPPPRRGRAGLGAGRCVYQPVSRERRSTQRSLRRDHTRSPAEGSAEGRRWCGADDVRRTGLPNAHRNGELSARATSQARGPRGEPRTP